MLKMTDKISRIVRNGKDVGRLTSFFNTALGAYTEAPGRLSHQV